MTRFAPILKEVSGCGSPEAVVQALGVRPGTVLLRSNYFQLAQARYTFIAANPFLTFQSHGARCSVESASGSAEHYGNPWRLLDELMARYELLEELDHPFPLGGCFGFWGYGLKNFVEPKLGRQALHDLDVPDSWVGFYSSVLVFDHILRKSWIVSTGLDAEAARTPAKAEVDLEFWSEVLRVAEPLAVPSPVRAAPGHMNASERLVSNLSRPEFIEKVRRAQEYIRQGHIYQVNLSHRLQAPWLQSGWDLFLRLKEVSPAPFSAYLNCGGFELASSSPELFLRMSGSQISTRPIKGTRPRGGDATRDAQLSYELQTSAKEISELVMITDLLRNDLGRVCEFGSIQVPDLVRLERFAQVQHLVSTVEGRLRPEVTHFHAFSSCFPGGSITGAPKVRAMEIIDELEPIARGPYTGALGYLGFNRESQLSIIIRTALVQPGLASFNVGAGIVADSIPEAEYNETLAKAAGFRAALGWPAIAPRPDPFPAEQGIAARHSTPG